MTAQQAAATHLSNPQRAVWTGGSDYSQATIKRAPEEQRRSLADLFGGNVGGPSSAPAAKPQHRSLASLFPAASGVLTAEAAAVGSAASDGPAAAAGSTGVPSVQVAPAAQQSSGGELDADGAAVRASQEHSSMRLQQACTAARRQSQLHSCHLISPRSHGAAPRSPFELRFNVAQVVAPRQRPVRQLAQQIEARTSPQKDGAGPQQSASSPSRGRGTAQIAGDPSQPAAASSGVSHSDSPSPGGSPAVDNGRSLRQRFEVASPRLPAAERTATDADTTAGSGPAEAQSGGSCSALLHDEQQPLTDDEAAAAEAPDVRGDSGSTSSSEPSPHGRLSEAYAHLSTSADAEDHQVPVHTVCCAAHGWLGMLS